MSENSKIEWTDHTFNPWWGCMKVSDGCKNCYAESLDNRYNHENPHWGPGSDRKPMGEAYWRQPIKWNAEAKKAGVKKKVFCASMADVFEGHPQTAEHLNRLFLLITDTPYLIWQLLTKRPENIMKLIPEVWRTEFPHNVWRGTSVENQKAADERIPLLLDGPPGIRFLSCEPLLGPVDLMYPESIWPNGPQMCCSGRKCGCMGQPTEPPLIHGIDWVICGGESGPHARPMHPGWARSLRDQCRSAGVAFHFKQWGEYGTTWVNQSTGEPVHKMYESYLQFTQKLWVNKGDACVDMNGKICRIGADFKDAAYPVAIMQKLGKKAAGRLLDGREHDEFPNTKTPADGTK